MGYLSVSARIIGETGGDVKEFQSRKTMGRSRNSRDS
jgi:hypothetical protein